jgi:AraC-like DNA-binding protein
MSTPLRALPVVAHGRLQLDACAATRVVHDGPVAQIVQWRCLHDGDALRAERSHTTYVMSLVALGACGVSDGAWKATIDPVTALLHRPDTAYRTHHPFGCIDSGWNIAVRRDVAGELLARAGVDERRWPRPSIAVTSRPALLGLRQLILMQRDRHRLPADPVAFEELALELLDAVVTHATRTATLPSRRATADDHGRVAESTREYLNAHFRGPLQLDAIATAVGASPAHLCRVFKAHAGMPIRTYVHRLRLAAALGAATSGDIHLDRAAVDAGFYSHSHMTTVCARILGASPAEIRHRAATAGPRKRARS